MELTLTRTVFLEDRTIGELSVGDFHCYTLEDAVRPEGIKIRGETAIPAGRYAIMVTMSPRFNRRLPLLMGVPNFSGVRIHGGNRPAHTEGCILVGSRYDERTHEISGNCTDEITRMLSACGYSHINIINKV